MDKSDLNRREMIAATAAIGLIASSDNIGHAATADASLLNDQFLNFSAEATGFSRPELEVTGQAADYLATVRQLIGEETFAELLQSYSRDGLDKVLASSKLGPIARNVIKVWYMSTWEPLRPDDRPFVISPVAYKQGLLWQAIGVNPPGADGPGYATWSTPA